jgi:hypothetical protein
MTGSRPILLPASCDAGKNPHHKTSPYTKFPNFGLKIQKIQKILLSMVSHTLKLVILGGKLTSVKKNIAGGQTYHCVLPIQSHETRARNFLTKSFRVF